jgi:hypothetical protein
MRPAGTDALVVNGCWTAAAENEPLRLAGPAYDVESSRP